jgi:hypothetical protein
MANFQTVYAILTLLISLMFIISFIVSLVFPRGQVSEETAKMINANGLFLTLGSISTMFFIFLGSIVVLVLRRKGAV